MSTQHRPLIKQSTKHYGQEKKQEIYDSMYRSGHMSPEAVAELTAMQQPNELVNASVPDATGVSLADASLTAASAAPRKKRHATDASKSATSPTVSPTVGGSPVVSKVSGGHSPKHSPSHPNPNHPKKGTKSRQAKSKYGAKSDKAHRLRSSKHASRTGNISRSKTKSKSYGLKINLPLTFENASAHGWVTWQPSNSSSQSATSQPLKTASEAILTSTITSAHEFRAHNDTDSSKSNLRMGTTIVHDKRVYEPINRKRRDVETTEKVPEKKEETKVEVQDVKPSNDSRRYFQSRRFR